MPPSQHSTSAQGGSSSTTSLLLRLRRAPSSTSASAPKDITAPTHAAHTSGGSYGSSRMLEMDGELYQLRTDDHMTDTSVDTTNEDFDDDINDDDVFANASVFEAEAKKAQDEAEHLRRRLQMVEGESHQRSKTIEYQEKEMQKVRAQLEEAERKLAQGEDTVNKANVLDAFMQQSMQLLKQEHDQEVARVREDARKEAVAQIQELQQQLEVARASTKVEETALINTSKHIEENVTQLKRELEAARTEAAEKSAEATRLQVHIDGLNDELDRRAIANTVTQTKILDVLGENERLKGALSARDLEVADAKKKLRGIDVQDRDSASPPLRKRSFGDDASAAFPQLVCPRLFRDPVVDRNWPLMFFALTLATLLLNALLFGSATQ